MSAADDLERLCRLLNLIVADLDDVAQRRNTDSLRRAIQRLGIARQLVAVIAGRKEAGDGA